MMDPEKCQEFQQNLVEALSSETFKTHVFFYLNSNLAILQEAGLETSAILSK